MLDPVAGDDLRPQAEVLVGLAADRPGRYVLRGLRIGYRVERRRATRARSRTRSRICATDPDDQAGACEPPP